MFLDDKYILDNVNTSDYQSFINTYLQLENTISFTEEKFIEVINENKKRGNIYLCIRLRTTNEIIGCGKLFFDIKLGNNKGYIDDVVIDRNYQNQKLGSYLIYKLLDYAKKWNCYVCLLNCKQELKEFYLKLGFKHDKLLMRYTF